MTEATRPASETILAVVTEQDAEPVHRRAIELARERGADLILYSADAGKRLFEDPLPTEWSAQGEEEQFGQRLTVNDLEAAGRAPLARQVAAARSAGVRAWGWLPDNADADTLRDYAGRQGVGTVVVARDAELAGDLDDGSLPVEWVAAAR